MCRLNRPLAVYVSPLALKKESDLSLILVICWQAHKWLDLLMIFMICAKFLFIPSMLSRQPKCDTLQHVLRQIYPRCLMYPQSKSKIVESFWIHSDIFDSTSNYVYWLFLKDAFPWPYRLPLISQVCLSKKPGSLLMLVKSQKLNLPGKTLINTSGRWHFI